MSNTEDTGGLEPKFYYPTMGEKREITPEDAILEEVHRTAGMVSFLGSQVSHAEGVAALATLPPAERERARLDARELRAMYDNERTRLIRVAHTAISVGIAERQIRLAEKHGEMLAMVMLAVITDDTLGLTPMQVTTAKKLVRQRIEVVMGQADEYRQERDMLVGIDVNAQELEAGE